MTMILMKVQLMQLQNTHTRTPSACAHRRRYLSERVLVLVRVKNGNAIPNAFKFIMLANLTFICRAASVN